VKFLEKMEEFELSKYCEEDVWVWWRNRMGYTGLYGIDTWIIEVGEHEIPDSGFLPYDFNFSENWVVLKILEEGVWGDASGGGYFGGYLNTSVRMENLENGMIIGFSFEYAGSPGHEFPRNWDREEDNVRCPTEKVWAYETGAAIAVGGISAIALVIGVAVWRRRRLDEIIGVPEPFVGGDDLLGIISPLDGDSSN
jgi:hypothetical protein